jgi:hypothetical protein
VIGILLWLIAAKMIFDLFKQGGMTSRPTKKEKK